MNRCSTGSPAALLLLLGVLLSGFAQASSTNDPIVDEPLLQSADWLALQHDMYLFDVNTNDELLSVMRQGPDTAVAHNSRLSPPAGNATALSAAPPAPSALWILGAAMIGLAAVSRRRTQPALNPA